MNRKVKNYTQFHETYHVHELLFHSQVMISNGQHCDPVLELFGVIDALPKLIAIFLLEGIFFPGRKVIHQ